MPPRHDKPSGAGATPSVMARIWPCAVLAAVVVAFLGRAIFTARALAPLDMLLLMSPWKAYAGQFRHFVHAQTPMLDPVQAYLPWRLYAAASFKHGIIPLWNPYAFSGTPFLANVQSAVLYPLNLLFLVMPVALGFTYTAVLHLVLAGSFMFFFLRVWGIGKWPAVAAAAAYMLNGCFVAWLEYPPIGLWVSVWLPLLLTLHELSIRRRSWPLTGLAGLVIGVQFLGGHLQIAAYVVVAFLLYALARTAWPAAGEGEARLRRWEPVMRGGAALALGLLLAAPQLVPTLEFAPLSHRPAISAATIQNTALPFTHLIIYLIPKFFGSPADYNYWGNLVGRPSINFFETSGYVGVLPLLLACFGALEWRRPLAKYLLTLAAVSLLIALGTPLYLPLFYAVPGFKQLAGVARIMCLEAFAITALAALGLDRLWRDRRAPIARVAGMFSLVAFGFVATDYWIFQPQITAFGRIGTGPAASFPRYLAAQVIIFSVLLGASWLVTMIRGRLRGMTFGALCLAVISADLFVAWVRFNPATDPRMAFFDTAATRFLQDHLGDGRMLAAGSNFISWMPPETPTAYCLRDIQGGSDSLWWGRYQRFLNTVQPGAPTFDWRNLDSPGLDLLAVRYIISTRPIADPAWQLVFDRDALIYRRRAPVLRARLVSDWRVGPGEKTLQALAAADMTLLRRPLVSAAPGIAPAPGAAPGTAEVIAERAHEIQVRCRAPAPRLLVLSEPDYPGWRTTIDGKAAPHLAANYILGAVAVPAGEHVVTWRYQPIGFRLGLFAGLVGVGLLVAILGASLVGVGQRRLAESAASESRRGPSAAGGAIRR